MVGRIIKLFVVLAFTAVGACGQPEKKSPYPILDSGMLASMHDPSAYIFWIDNHRILFRAVKNNDKRLANIGPYNLSVWEIGKGTRPYTPYALNVSACLRDGIFRYKLKDEYKNIQLFHGRFGEEIHVPLPPKMSYYDDMNCRLEDDPEVAEKHRSGRAILKLLTRHGFLDIGPARGKGSSENRQVELHIKGKKLAITLPIRRFDILVIEYYEFKDAYFISHLGAYSRTGKPATARWLYPDGRVEEVLIPVGPWATSVSTSAYPTRHGIFVVSHDYKTMQNSGLAGGYFIQGEKAVKVIDGSIRGVAVSPDGCKISFSHARTLMHDVVTNNDPTRRTLKMINFCIFKDQKTGSGLAMKHLKSTALAIPPSVH